MRKALTHPGLALRAAAAAWSYRGPPSRRLRLTASEVNAASAQWELIRRPGKLGASVIAFQRAFCYHTAYLYALCREVQPDIVVETGVYWGASSAFVLQALKDNAKGHLYSIDQPPRAHPGRVREVEAGATIPAALRQRWTLVVGDARDELEPLLGRIGAVDLFHHDSEHTRVHMAFEFEAAFAALRPGGLLVSDDALWNSAFSRFCAAHGLEPTMAAGVGMARKAGPPKG